MIMLIPCMHLISRRAARVLPLLLAAILLVSFSPTSFATTDELAREIHALLERSDRTLWRSFTLKVDGGQLARFYRMRDFAPAWTALSTAEQN